MWMIELQSIEVEEAAGGSDNVATITLSITEYETINEINEFV